MPYAFVAFGIVLLIVGSETVVRGGVGLAAALRLSPLLIGLVIVSAGTSAPELVISLNAAMKGAPDIAVGNVVGSNILNTLLILGLGALIRPLPAPPKIVWRDGLIMAAASLALLAIARTGHLGAHTGFALLAAFALYILLAFFTDWRRAGGASAPEARARKLAGDGQGYVVVSLFLLILGFVALYVGARIVVDGSVALARSFQVPEALIALTVIALGTSLPELITTVVASARGQSQLAIGHLIGSNIFNILAVLGATAAIHPVTISPVLAGADIWVMAGAAVLLIPIMATGWRVTRGQGFFLALLYLVYLGFLGWREGLIHLPMFG